LNILTSQKIKNIFYMNTIKRDAWSGCYSAVMVVNDGCWAFLTSVGLSTGKYTLALMSLTSRNDKCEPFIVMVCSIYSFLRGTIIYSVWQKYPYDAKTSWPLDCFEGSYWLKLACLVHHNSLPMHVVCICFCAPYWAFVLLMDVWGMRIGPWTTRK